MRAAWSNLSSNGSTQGASTITQQYVKLLYLSQERTWSRKIKEAFISVKIDQELSKQQILEGYLNTIYFGRGAYGVDAAAQAYFQKPAKDLTVPRERGPGVGAELAEQLRPGGLQVEPGSACWPATATSSTGWQQMGNLSPADAARYEQALPPHRRPEHP